MEVFGEEHTEGWVRTQVKDLGAHVGEWVMVDPHPHAWGDRQKVVPQQGKLLSVQFKDYRTGKYVDFVHDGTWGPSELRITVTGWGGKNEVRDIYPRDTAYVYDGDLDFPEPYSRLAEDTYPRRKGFSGLELVATYWHAVAMKDEQLAELLYRFSTEEGI